MLHIKYIAMLSLFIFPISGVALERTDSLLMCVDNYPPLQIINKDKVTGENVEVTKALANKLEIPIAFTIDTPFKRCIQQLKSGQIDIMAGVLSSPDRREFAHLMLYDDLTSKTFFINKNQPQINTFSDLKGLNIGMLRGVQHFKEFDNAPKGDFNKVEVSSLSAAFGMLAKGRVDAVVSTDYYGHNVIKRNPELNHIIQTNYKVNTGTQVYIALSKKSPYSAQHKRFEQAVHDMFVSGEFAKIIVEFQTHHPEYY